jgi:hypothetical protein
MAIQEKNQYKIFKIDNPWWELKHRDLDFYHEDFNNSADIQEWQKLGYTQSRFTGDMYDMRNPEPEWIAPFREIINMPKFSWSVYRMRPGDVLPNHADTYAMFRKIHNLDDFATIRRYVVFLEPWQSGHYFEIDGVQLPNWEAGTVAMWENGIMHVAANVGKTYRYTLQITGVVEFKTA